LLIAFAIGGAIAWFTPAAAFGRAADVVASVLGLLLAGVLTGMAVTAAALQPSRLGKPAIKGFAAGLRRQMGFWMGLFVLGLITAGVLAVGEAMEWGLPTPRPQFIPDWVPAEGGRWLGFALLVPLSVWVMRLPAFYRALVSLIGLSEKAALAEHDEEAAAARAEAAEELQHIKSSPDFGKVIRPH